MQELVDDFHSIRRLVKAFLARLKDFTLSNHDEIFLKATANGCEPRWRDGIFGWRWHCFCKGNKHGMDQQCSAITLESAARKFDICRKEPGKSGNF